MASILRLARLFVVLAAGAFAHVFGCELAVLFNHPTVAVGVVGRLVCGAMYLAWPIQDNIQLGGSILVSFRGLLSRP